jgi:protein-tyrosine-phosphatase
VNDVYTIMFVCTGNTCRSPMAQVALDVLLEKNRPGKFRVISSGTIAAAGYPATDYGQEAARLWDCDLSGHQSQRLSRQLIEESDLILAMGPEHLQEVLRLSPEAADRSFLFKNFPDPTPTGERLEDPIGQSLDKYNETFLEIGEYLGINLDEFVKRIDERINA